MLNIIAEYYPDNHDRTRGKIAKYVIGQRMKILYSDVYSSNDNMVLDIIVTVPWHKVFKRMQKYRSEIQKLSGVDNVKIKRI